MICALRLTISAFQLGQPVELANQVPSSSAEEAQEGASTRHGLSPHVRDETVRPQRRPRAVRRERLLVPRLQGVDEESAPQHQLRSEVEDADSGTSGAREGSGFR